jgi:hypothetical protein
MRSNHILHYRVGHRSLESVMRFSKTWGILDIHVVDQGITFYKKVPKDGAWSKLYSLAGVVKKQRVLSDYIP